MEARGSGGGWYQSPVPSQFTNASRSTRSAAQPGGGSIRLSKYSKDCKYCTSPYLQRVVSHPASSWSCMHTKLYLHFPLWVRCLSRVRILNETPSIPRLSPTSFLPPLARQNPSSSLAPSYSFSCSLSSSLSLTLGRTPLSLSTPGHPEGSVPQRTSPTPSSATVL